MSARPLLSLGSLLLATMSFAQEPVATVLPPGDHAVLDRIHGVQELDGRLHGSGRGYRVDFDAAGARFHAALGQDAPGTVPLAFRLRSVARGGASVAVEASGVAPRSADGRVEYPRGAGVRERYECRNNGMELSFVFERPVPGDGDLVVTMELATALAPCAIPVGERAGVAPIRLEAAQGGGVEIGGVTGIDAAGRRTAGAIRLREGFLEMSLPADFVADAAWPLVLDPLVTGFSSPGATGNARDPASAYSSEYDLYCTVYTVDLSATDSDIFAQFYRGADGQPVGTPIRLSARTDREIEPRVAVVDSQDSFVVVWRRLDAGDWDVEGRCIRIPDRQVGPRIDVVSNDNSQVDVEICGNVTGLGDYATVFWREVGRPGFQSCDIEVPDQSTDFQSAWDFGPELRDLVVSRTGGSAGRIVVCGIWDPPGGSGTEAFVQVFDRRRSPVTQQLTRGFFGRVFGLDLGIQADGAAAHLVYAAAEQFNGMPTTLGDIWVQRLSWGGSGVIAQSFPSRVETRQLDHQYAPAVASLADDLLVVGWADTLALGAPDVELRFTNLLLRGQTYERCGREFTSRTATLQRHDALRLCSQFEAGGTRDHALVAFAERNLVDFSERVRVAGWEAIGNGGLIRDLGGSCGLGGFAVARRPFAIGSPDLGFAVLGVNGSTSALTALTLSFDAAPNLVRCGAGCAVLPGPIAENVAIDAFGNGSFALPRVCAAGLFGLPVNAQFVTLTPTSSPCGFAPVSVSNVVQAVLGD